MISSCRPLAAVLPMAVLVSVALAPAAADASPRHKGRRVARVVSDSRTCQKAPVEVVAGAESATFALVDCQGSATNSAIDKLSILARPGSVAAPDDPAAADAKSRGADVPFAVRRIDSRLVERLETVVDHFRAADGKPERIRIVSGVRPRSTGSYHTSGRALDFRLDGVSDEALVAFCKTLPDTGCGYYPNSGFVHMDVRDPGTGHVAWIDASRPGERPHYVSSWPPPGTEPDDGAKLPALPNDGHPSLAMPVRSSDKKSRSTRSFW